MWARSVIPGWMYPYLKLISSMHSFVRREIRLLWLHVKVLTACIGEKTNGGVNKAAYWYVRDSISKLVCIRSWGAVRGSMNLLSRNLQRSERGNKNVCPMESGIRWSTCFLYRSCGLSSGLFRISAANTLSASCLVATLSIVSLTAAS
ncbi:hypothetical protein BHM03_00044138 [Ensete ventricosum]|nr:hypothetical protein BHM03_00044138 [Ensete ventricosum]